MWIKKLRHKKVKYLFTGHHSNNMGKAFTRPDAVGGGKGITSTDSVNETGPTDADRTHPLHPSTGQPLKPSEVIARASIDDSPNAEESDSDEVDVKLSSSSPNEGEGPNERAEDVDSDGDEKYLNEDVDYYGPFNVTTPYLSQTCASDPNGEMSVSGIRVVRVYEDDIKHQYYPLHNVPPTVHV